MLVVVVWCCLLRVVSMIDVYASWLLCCLRLNGVARCVVCFVRCCLMIICCVLFGVVWSLLVVRCVLRVVAGVAAHLAIACCALFNIGCSAVVRCCCA